MTTADLVLERRASSAHGIAIILVASLLFGVMAVAVRVASRDMPALQIAFVRFFGSLVVLLIATRGRQLRPRSGRVKPLLLRGLLGGGSIMFYYIGIEHAGAGFATLLHCTYPVWTALLAVLVLGETFSVRTGVALALNLAGILVVLGPSASLSEQTVLGGISALVASMLAGGAVATARHLRATEEASLITIYFMAVGAALSAPAMLGASPAWSVPLVAALAVVIVSSVSAQWLLHHGLGFASATQGSLAAATTVISAAGLEAVALGEHLDAHTLVGACGMFAAVALAMTRPRPAVSDSAAWRESAAARAARE